MTYCGSLSKKNDCTFSSEELLDVLSFLQIFFAFSFGSWLGPQLAVGFDSDNEVVYQELGLRRISRGPWDGLSWLDVRNSDFLTDLSSNFWSLWQIPIWKKTLNDTTHWYCAANRVGESVLVDSALLFTQSALELLSWTYCVKDKALATRDDFGPRGMKAKEKINLLLNELGIPIEIPAVFNAMHNKRGAKWKDSGEVITELRNGLVHPGKDKQYLEGTYFEAWQLSQWLIEMTVLAVCGYSGKYGNRYRGRTVGCNASSSMRHFRS